MTENYIVCHCKQIYYYDIVDTLRELNSIADTQDAFEQLQRILGCSTVCGNCREKVLQAISDAMYGYDSTLE